ncbi:MAG TPA: AAA family ATPase, partial [Solirubrobacteraceae bacterium]|nr:AAA family ATPase [Solirubrobacteraceae bacterium]
MQNLFDQPADDPGADGGSSDGPGGSTADGRPLATRVRPRRLQELVGQAHVLGEGSALRAAIEQGRPHSMVLYGPPGSGKTTIARMLAARSRAHFEELSAVAAGRAEVRAVIERAQRRREGLGAD